MKIYRYFLVSLAAVMVMASCQKNSDPRPVVEDDGLIQLTVGVKGANVTTQTKGDTVSANDGGTEVGTDDENAVNSIQVFVFKKNGADYIFETSVKANGASTTLAVTSGTKNIIVLANEPVDFTVDGNQSVQERDELYALISRLPDNNRSSFRMVGEQVDFLLDGTQPSATCTVPITRLVSRIEIKKVTNSLLYGYASKNVQVVRAYLTWASEKVNYDINAQNHDAVDMHYYQNYYATVGINSRLDLDGAGVQTMSEKNAVNALAYKQINSNVLADGASLNEPIVLYTYPNDLAGHPTHVVVEMLIDNHYYTYPVELPALEQNYSYQINNLILKHVGNPSDGDDDIEGEEDDPITHVDCTFNVDVQPWHLIILDNGDGNTWTI